MARAAVGAARRRRPVRRAVVGVTAVLTSLGLVACAGPPVTDDAASAQLTSPAASSPPATPAPVDEEQADGATGTSGSEDGAEPTTDDGGSSEVGALVAGFPVDLLPVPDDAMVLVTSTVPVGTSDMTEVSLNLRTRSTTEDLVTLYRDSLTAAGFTEVEPEVPQTAMAAELTFVRSGGDELVSVGVLDVDDGRTVAIGGRVRADEP